MTAGTVTFSQGGTQLGAPVAVDGTGKATFNDIGPCGGKLPGHGNL